MLPSPMTVKSQCRCEERQEAQRNGRLSFNAFYRGFIFALGDGTPRRKNGGPFIWLDCPWCGGTLLPCGED